MCTVGLRGRQDSSGGSDGGYSLRIGLRRPLAIHRAGLLPCRQPCRGMGIPPCDRCIFARTRHVDHPTDQSCWRSVGRGIPPQSGVTTGVTRGEFTERSFLHRKGSCLVGHRLNDRANDPIVPLRIAFDLDGVFADMDGALTQQARALFGTVNESVATADDTGACAPTESASPEPPPVPLPITARQQRRLWEHIERSTTSGRRSRDRAGVARPARGALRNRGDGRSSS